MTRSLQSTISRDGGEKDREEEVTTSRAVRQKNLLLIILVVFLAVILLSAGALFMVKKLGFAASLFGEPPGDSSVAKEIKEPEFMYAFPEIIVNMPEGGRRFLSVKFYLGHDEPKLEEELEKRMPEIRDVVNKILWTKDAGEVSTPEGKEELREELLEAINVMLHNGQLRGLYFWHVLVQ